MAKKAVEKKEKAGKKEPKAKPKEKKAAKEEKTAKEEKAAKAEEKHKAPKAEEKAAESAHGKKPDAEGIISPGFLATLQTSRSAGPREALLRKEAKKAEKEEKPKAEHAHPKRVEVKEKAKQGAERAESAAAHAGKKRGVPSWVELKPAEATEAIVSLANAGNSGSEIGMLLRDQYGVPSIKDLCGKSVEEILKDHNLMAEVPEDLMNLIRKSVKLRKHLAKNKKDGSAKRGLLLTVSKIRALVRYYKKKGRLPVEWQYTEGTAALLVK